MTGDRPYSRLLSRWHDAALLESSAAILAWDQETMMPAGGVAHRAAQLEQLARLAHERKTDPEIGDLLAACAADAGLRDPASEDGACLREIGRRYQRERRLPLDLVAAIAETTSLAQHHWAECRLRSDFAGFRPWLERVFALMRSKADCLATSATQEPWDELADGFEPGVTARQLAGLFAPLRAQLTALLARLQEARAPAALPATPVPVARQEACVRVVAQALGFDFTRGRLDRSAHPFCGGSHAGDVRMTTRFHEADWLDGLGSTMHETGHALYEQGLPPARFGTPLGEAASLGMHESQSRLWENHVGRSRAFCRWLAPRLPELLGLGVVPDADALFAAANQVRPSLIRVEADEVTYDLHVMIRFELELALLRGELAVADLPERWNQLYRDVLGVTVPDDRRGCLQDVHWSCGLIGYFPTYTLGNVYAAQLWARLGADLGNVDALVERGEFAPIREWLRTRVHVHGARYPAARLVELTTGAAPTAEAMLTHLHAKFLPLYGLA